MPNIYRKHFKVFSLTIRNNESYWYPSLKILLCIFLGKENICFFI